MSLVVVDTGKRPVLGYMLDGFNGTNLRVHLFKNLGLVPDHDTVIGDMDEADFDGYVIKDLNATWVLLAGLDAGRRATGQAVRCTWALTATPVTPNTIFGYYVTDSANSVLYWAEAFGSSQPMVASGDFISFKPTLTLRSEFSN